MVFEQQAHHAFETYPEVNAFGAFVALGGLLDLQRVLSGRFETISHSIQTFRFHLRLRGTTTTTVE
ncbi:hypothetical protein BYT27DRAFT_7192528, partial [Phlegmacium glaucopus]